MEPANPRKSGTLPCTRRLSPRPARRMELSHNGRDRLRGGGEMGPAKRNAAPIKTGAAFTMHVRRATERSDRGTRFELARGAMTSPAAVVGVRDHENVREASSTCIRMNHLIDKIGDADGVLRWCGHGGLCRGTDGSQRDRHGDEEICQAFSHDAFPSLTDKAAQRQPDPGITVRGKRPSSVDRNPPTS